MNRFINYIVEKSKALDLVLNINYSSHKGWDIKLYKKGYDMPSVDVVGFDKDSVFDRAYSLTEKYLEDLKKGIT